MYLIEGNIGAGKSTFLQLINNNLPHLNAVFEPVNVWQKEEHGRSLLQNFYTDTPRWAYSMETFTLINRIHENSKINDRNVAIAERSIYSGYYCFAKNSYLKGFMSNLEWGMYKQWFNFLTDHSSYQEPSGFIYLRTTPKVAYERIIKRNRAAENLISFDYVSQIHQRHEELLILGNEINISSKVLVLDANTDFESNPVELEKMITKVRFFISSQQKSTEK
jgi:deoxyadenosine/deoxycytidine kinase